VRVLRIDKKLEALQKPSLQAVENISLTTGDYLIVCAGFEDRVLAVLDSALQNSSHFKLFIVNYLPFVCQNHSLIIQEKCVKAGISFTEITYDRLNPSGFGDFFIKQVNGCRGRIFIDISGMSRLLIVQVLVALGKRTDSFRGCSVAYAEAQTYPPSQEAAESAIEKLETDATFSVLFLSSGMFDVTIVPELSSSAIPIGQTRLIAFPSLDAYQLTALRAELQPSRFSFIHGVPPNPKNAWRADAIRKINRLDILEHDSCNASTLDYRETLNCLLQIYGKHSDHQRLLISPTGSKMQAVAVGLFRAYFDDAQIVYPTPKAFLSPMDYTKGVGQLHLLPLDNFCTTLDMDCVASAPIS
jgi:hypothetical protein